MPNTSRLIEMRIFNLGCIGTKGLTITLDEIVCIVGANNSGKSTVLRAYEAAVLNQKLTAEEFHGGEQTVPATVELWIHIPPGAENIDEKWKETKDGLLVVRSKWTWESAESAPVRKTWSPEMNDYADDDKASGLDTVFSSRLPKPFRIGSLENPEEEHKKLLELVLGPVHDGLQAALELPGSPLQSKLSELKTEANLPLDAFKIQISEIVKKINRSYQRVFGAATVDLKLSLGDLGLDLSKALTKSSTLTVAEADGQGHWSRQGTGSQRALFWSMLEIRSELKRSSDHKDKLDKEMVAIEKKLATEIKKLAKATTEKAKQGCLEQIECIKAELAVKKDQLKIPAPQGDGFLPGHMLLIDEPETALHPSAIRGAREHLYSLARESGWQVMITTHHPAFVDPAEDHTTIVRLRREAGGGSPKVYRSDTMNFSPDEKQQLKSLLAFDLDLAEMFFGNPVIIVEGDTEYACFNSIMDRDPAKYPVDQRPLILRAHGKATIPIIIRMLAHFRVNFTILHDIDSPFTKEGDRTNPAFSVNANISSAIANARNDGLKITHRCSCPNFEQAHNMQLPKKEKPLSAWNAMNSPAISASVSSVLEELTLDPDAAVSDGKDGADYEHMINEWIANSGKKEPRYAGQ